MAKLSLVADIIERPNFAARQTQIKAIIEQAIKPLNDWEEIKDPERYIETRLGRYIHLLEGLLDRAAAIGDADRVHAITLDLIRLSKLGRAKAEVNITGPSKLRDEIDFKSLSDDEVAAKLQEIKNAVEARR